MSLIDICYNEGNIRISQLLVERQEAPPSFPPFGKLLEELLSRKEVSFSRSRKFGNAIRTERCSKRPSSTVGKGLYSMAT